MNLVYKEQWVTIFRASLQIDDFKRKVGSHLATLHPKEDGVPQGSVLSCSLFSVAINGILACLPHNVKGLLYVDDLLIYSSGSYYPAIEQRIQVAINSVHGWVLKRGFTFSPAKSVAIHFHRKRTMQPPATLFIAGRLIPARECIKYLGMLLDRAHRIYQEGLYEKIRPVEVCIKRLLGC